MSSNKNDGDEQRAKAARLRTSAMRELVVTERDYVRNLRTLLLVYVEPMLALPARLAQSQSGGGLRLRSLPGLMASLGEGSTSPLASPKEKRSSAPSVNASATENKKSPSENDGADETTAATTNGAEDAGDEGYGAGGSRDQSGAAGETDGAPRVEKHSSEPVVNRLGAASASSANDDGGDGKAHSLSEHRKVGRSSSKADSNRGSSRQAAVSAADDATALASSTVDKLAQLRGVQKFPQLATVNKGDIVMLFTTVRHLVESNRRLLNALLGIDASEESETPPTGAEDGGGGGADADAGDEWALPNVDDLSDEDVDALRVGDAFVRHELHYYSVYCNHQSQALADIQTLMTTNTSFRAVIDACRQDARARNLSLLDFVVKPFQRVLKYPLLLREILKRTPPEHPDYRPLQAATKKLQEAVDEINRNKMKADNLKKLLQINQNVKELPRGFRLVDPSRKFLLEGDVGKISGRMNQTRHLFLFNDSLMYCKRKGEEKYLCRGIIKLSDLEYEDLADTKQMSNAIRLDRRDKKLTYYIYMRSVTEKDVWLKALRAAKQTLNTLTLSTKQYSDKDEFRDVIGVVRVYYQIDRSAPAMFKTLAIGTTVTTADLVLMFLMKMKLHSELGDEQLDLTLHTKKETRVLEAHERPLEIQLKLISQGWSFPSEENRFEISFPDHLLASISDELSRKASVSYTRTPSSSLTWADSPVGGGTKGDEAAAATSNTSSSGGGAPSSTSAAATASKKERPPLPEKMLTVSDLKSLMSSMGKPSSDDSKASSALDLARANHNGTAAENSVDGGGEARTEARTDELSSDDENYDANEAVDAPLPMRKASVQDALLDAPPSPKRKAPSRKTSAAVVDLDEVADALERHQQAQGDSEHKQNDSEQEAASVSHTASATATVDDDDEAAAVPRDSLDTLALPLPVVPAPDKPTAFVSPRSHGGGGSNGGGAMSPRGRGAMSPRGRGAMSPRGRGAMSPRGRGAMSPRSPRALSPISSPRRSNRALPTTPLSPRSPRSPRVAAKLPERPQESTALSPLASPLTSPLVSPRRSNRSLPQPPGAANSGDAALSPLTSPIGSPRRSNRALPQPKKKATPSYVPTHEKGAERPPLPPKDVE